MTFEDWWAKESESELKWGDLGHVKAAWNAAINAATFAVESADHNDDDSGNSAICSAIIAIERLEAT